MFIAPRLVAAALAAAAVAGVAKAAGGDDVALSLLVALLCAVGAMAAWRSDT